MVLKGIKEVAEKKKVFDSMTEDDKKYLGTSTLEEFIAFDKNAPENKVNKLTGLTTEETKVKKKPRKAKLKIEKPDVDYDEKLKEKRLAKASPIKITVEQFNTLIHTTTVIGSGFIHKQPVRVEDTSLFSQQLFSIATINGWLENVDFIPYLLLFASATELAIKMNNQPPTAKKQKTPPVIIEHGQPKTVIDDDELIKKIGGVSNMTDEERKKKLEGFTNG